MARHSGFTLVELMVTIVVAAVLLAIAVPNFSAFFVRNRIRTYTNDFFTALNIARSEAIRRGQPVSVCKSNDGSDCGGAWSDGWIVFVNKNDDKPADVDSGEPILRVHEALSSNYTLGAASNFTNYVTYYPNGSANNIGSFAFCHNGETASAGVITLTRLRPRVDRDASITDCSNP